MSGDAATRVDMHVKVLDDRVVDRAKARGIDVLVYAPHFTRLPAVREAAAAHSDEELLVVPAREVFTGDWRRRRHLLAVDLDDPVPDFISVEAALAEFARQGAAVLVPHPGFANVSLGAADLAAHRERLHAVESFNAKCLGYQNRRAARLARASDLPTFASSYAHFRPSVGEAWTTFEAAIDSPTALATALREGVPRRVERRSGLAHRARALAEFAHLSWENTWGKFDRLFLGGMEPTHPKHAAYEGRFDDASVY